MSATGTEASDAISRLSPVVVMAVACATPAGAGTTPAAARRALSRANPCSTALSSFCSVMGFSRKANAPMRVAPTAVSSGELQLSWPAKGMVVGRFDDSKNKGLNIAADAGAPVYAAGAGKVVYSGAGLRGYGNLVIIKHDATFLTAYAHNRKLLVKEGDSVTRGQQIAEMGSSDADRVMLHFEVRKDGKPVDPMKYLPPQ